jgi:hypothetical protein
VAESLDKLTKKLSQPPYSIGAFIAVALVIVLGIIIFQSLNPQKESTITEDQIRIQKGDRIVIVDRNGLVEYRTEKGVFYEVWDSSQIASFFASIEEKARKYLENPNPEICTSGYTVTLFLDGEEVDVCLEDDEELDEIFEEFTDGEGEEDLSEIFDGLLESPGPSSTPTPTPIPTTLIVSGEEGEEGNGVPSAFQVLACDLYQQLVTTRTIISNTLCVAAPSPTPSPTPTASP